MADNLRANQACLNLYKDSCKHPAGNEELENLYLLYDSIRL